MRFEMKMPDLATTDSPLRIIRWIAPAGQHIRRGEPLLEIETDKATMEVESAVSGVLEKTLAGPGDTAAAGEVIAIFEVEKGGARTETASTSPAAASATASTTAAAVPAAPVPAASVPAASAPGEPPARGGMFARNRQTAAAAPRAAASPAPVADSSPIQSVDAIPLNGVERTAARRLQESKQTVPHFYLQTSANAQPLIAARKAAEPDKILWDAFFAVAAAKALARFPRLAYRFDGERLSLQPADAVGVAVDLDGVLYVAAIDCPAAKSPRKVSDEIRAAVERLRRGEPESRRLQPARITISNLGGCNVESFIPIVNPPEAAILGIGKVMATPVARDSRIEIQHRVNLTLAVDHRVANGRYAGNFLGAVVQEIESF